MVRLVILLCALAFTAVASAATPPLDAYRGTWVWQVEGRNLFVLTLDAAPTGLTGTLQRPTQITLTLAAAGLAVNNIRMPPIAVPVQYVRATPEGHVLRVTDAAGVASEVSLRLDEKGGALYGFSASQPAAPVAHLSRPRDATALATDWEPGRTYFFRVAEEASNDEMAAIFAVDQADRKEGRKTDWAVVGPRDVARRARVRKMLDDGLIRSADDYYYAAFVFQHGDRPEDYLLAHVLAMASQGKGRADAAWIAMATLDRYLHSVGQAQVLGTQFVNGEGGSLSQGKQDKALIPDSLRKALGVPTLAEQQEQLKQMEAAGR